MFSSADSLCGDALTEFKIALCFIFLYTFAVDGSVLEIH